MHVLGRVKLPKSADVANLYLQCDHGTSLDYQSGKQEILLSQGSTISSNSYFNSFYEQFYAKYTDLESVYYLLKIAGDFQVTLYREVYQGDHRELLFSQQFTDCQLAVPTKIDLPNLTQVKYPGRIYFELKCLTEQGLFKEGMIATEQAKGREVSLGIITCTFKKETYVKNTVNTILQDDLLQSKALKVFVIDNGRTLTSEDFVDPRVQLIANRNVGGSGGFTRGLVEALREDSYTHFLLMDDDIELESESIQRLFSLYEYAKFDFSVAGSMLDLYKKQVLHEAGALYGKHDGSGSNLFSITSLKSNTELQDLDSLNLLLLEENIDYGAFWFFAFPKRVVEDVGLPMPFFIKIDDIEFGLRIKESPNSTIVAFPSIAVWHEPFYAKFPVWDLYYVFRNSLITDVIHSSLEYTSAIRLITEGLIMSLSVFDYNSAQMVIEAFEDYMEGPDFIKKTTPEMLHSNLLKLCKSYKSQNIHLVDAPPDKYEQESRPKVLKKLASLLTLNGHLLPDFLTSNDEEVLIWHGPGYSGQRTRAFAKRKVLIYKEGNTYLIQNEIDKPAGIKLLTRWLKAAAKSSTRWSSISREWKNASKDLTSTTFWQQYLGLEKS